MSTQHVLILRSSPRKRANSSILADQVADGARAAGAAVESFDLHTMNIKPCDACDYCQGLGNGQCAIDDDMQVLYPKLMQAESLVIATPIYWFTISAQAKLCIDRWYALQGSGGSALAGKKIGIVLTYGDEDPYTSGAVNAMRAFQDMFRYVGAEIVGFVYGTASRPAEIEGKPEILARAYKLGRQLGASA
jgi:multimeric flavodoxin WrbA